MRVLFFNRSNWVNLKLVKIDKISEYYIMYIKKHVHEKQKESPRKARMNTGHFDPDPTVQNNPGSTSPIYTVQIHSTCTRC